MNDTLQIATLRRALATAGDIFELSLRIGPSVETLLSMLRGHAEIDTWVFLRLVDYINGREHAGAIRLRAVDYHRGPATRQ